MWCSWQKEKKKEETEEIEEKENGIRVILIQFDYINIYIYI